MEYKIPIPNCYLGLTAGYPNRSKLFKKYVEGYLAKSFPEMRLIRISGMTAICERCEVFEEWKSAYQETKNRNKRSRSKSK